MERDIRQVLDVTIRSPYWEQAYLQALQEPEQPHWLTEDYLLQLHREWGITPGWMWRVCWKQLLCSGM